jgi:hypothetical protein
MTHYTIPPGAVLDYSFDFNGPTPGPALRAGQNLGVQTVTATGGLVVVSSTISSAQVLVRVSCPESVPLGTRCTVRVSTTTTGTGAGEVLVDQLDIAVGY